MGSPTAVGRFRSFARKLFLLPIIRTFFIARSVFPGFDSWFGTRTRELLFPTNGILTILAATDETSSTCCSGTGQIPIYLVPRRLGGSGAFGFVVSKCFGMNRSGNLSRVRKFSQGSRGACGRLNHKSQFRPPVRRRTRTLTHSVAQV